MTSPPCPRVITLVISTTGCRGQPQIGAMMRRVWIRLSNQSLILKILMTVDIEASTTKSWVDQDAGGRRLFVRHTRAILRRRVEASSYQVSRGGTCGAGFDLVQLERDGAAAKRALEDLETWIHEVIPSVTRTLVCLPPVTIAMGWQC